VSDFFKDILRQDEKLGKREKSQDDKCLMAWTICFRSLSQVDLFLLRKRTLWVGKKD
jgi:hypothetical protein